MTKEEIQIALELHRMWLNKEGGEKADFSRKDLRGASFYREDLRLANFAYADLRGANFEEAMLDDAIFDGANLSGANLSGANLSEAKMTDAQLTNANMRGTNIDYSAIPMWCGLFDVAIDKRIAAQWLYHFCRFQCDDPEVIEAQNAVMNLANQFHRIGECLEIERRGE